MQFRNFNSVAIIVALLTYAAIVRADKQQPLEAPPTDNASASAPSRLRVLSYNIKHGRGNDGKVELERAAEVINRLEPDLVALQEIDNVVDRSGKVDQAARLGELTDRHPAFGSFFDYQGGEYGMAILSKFPLVETKNLRLPDGAEPRTSLIVTVKPWKELPEIVFASVHFYASEQQRLAQAKKLLEEFAEEKRPSIIAGDFNSMPDSQVLKLFADEWAFPDKGEGRLTFASDDPRREIDHILFRPKDRFRIEKIDVIDEPIVSDHRPLLIDLLLVDRPTE
ncbi:MAG: endonuclease/exonuclease/phosphatase family protein [Aeoliella sp.]